ncbi:hypothetical protein CYLTODRAFT_437499 [Cylindrobasidium torrendii FP15055 ss-10]|uniref:SPRY domain-containing protein n=1 Tax=Cylindrobasidium torrendii FP15055 ss-10 TaxID=1314674 RepID=A0A0D7B809_9AGAR|nr:hypothetical protein CYLTODRAFT_437499 [Cylindrobasidium torrendii FP15055 ss-10]
MHAGSTPPPSQAPSPTPTLPPTAQVTQNRKRKREATTDSSPAPDVQAPSPLVTSRDLSKRPVLTISRGPTFHPVPDEPDFFKTDLHGVNIRGYRYTPAGISPPGSGSLFRTIECNPRSYRVSWEDRGQLIQVTKDGLGLLGWKGYKSARCNAPIREGKWYMEVKILRGGGARGPRDNGAEGSSVRLGWARREAMLTGPAGQDGYSYAYRDSTGEKVTLARPKPYGKPFRTGDVVGMYISLPPKRQPNPKDPQDPAHIRRDRIAIDLKGQEAFEIKEYAQTKEMEAIMEYAKKSMNTTSVPSATVKKANVPKPEKPAAKRPAPAPLRPLPKLEGSTIAFFVNGEPQGAAFEDIYDYLQLRPADAPTRNHRKRATEGGLKRHKEDICFDDGSLGYYPFISLFNSGAVRMNPGPDFAFTPPPDIDAVVRGQPVKEDQERTWRPICERYPEYMQEQDHRER